MSTEDKVTVCRLMQPNDANIMGNVHGGIILKMIEEAGMIVSTRHCNSNMNPQSEESSSITALARVERTDFLKPMFVGEVANLSADITYCSARSLEVMVDVVAENIRTGQKRLTNRATLWYVPVRRNMEVGVVPPIFRALTAGESLAGTARYEEQKADRAKSDAVSAVMFDAWAMSLDAHAQGGEIYTVANAQSALIQFVGVQDGGIHGKVTGGFTMKLMDEVAGITASRHCHTPCVTASLDATNFHKSINTGSVVNVRGRPIFTSAKSILVQAVVLVEERGRSSEGKSTKGVIHEIFCACSAFFTFVSLDHDGKTLPVPGLKLTSDAERLRFEEGRKMYEQQKLKRKSSQTTTR